MVDIDVEGNRVASRALILGVSSLEVGVPLTPTATGETIRRLYGLGIFSDVRLEAEPITGGLKVVIVVEELPKLTGLAFSGNKKLESKELKSELGLGIGGYISPYLIHQKKNQIAEMYAEDGYFQAVITPELTFNEDSSEASLVYTIDEKSKVKVEEVVMTGNDRVNAGDAIGKMRNRKRGFLRTSDFAQDKYDEDLEKVIDEFHNQGFIDAYLVSDSMTIDSLRNRMKIYLQVYEGPRYYFGKAEFSGNEVLPTKFLKGLLEYDENEVFDAEKYGAAIDAMHSAYWDVGHLHANVTDARTTREDSLIDVTYRIAEGLPSHVNMVKIIGNYKTKERVIRREVSVLPGQVFNQNLLIRSIRDVMALNYFESVIPTPLGLPNGDVDLEFEVTEKRTGEIMAGVGYNATDKLVGNLGMGIPNFRGMGQNVSFNIQFGSQYNSFSLSFTEPWAFGRPTTVGASAFTTNREWYDDYTEGQQGFSLKLGRRLRWPDNYFRIYAPYSLKRTRYYDFDSDFVKSNSYRSSYYYDANGDGIGDVLLGQASYDPYPGSILQYNEDWFTSSRIAFNIVRDSRNLPQFATKGSIISYTFENTGGIMGGFWHYQKHTMELTKFFPIYKDIALAASVQYGVVTSPDGDDRILVSDRFTPGGTYYDGTVRGYDGGSLTPDSIVVATDTTALYSDPNALPGVDPPDTVLTNAFQARVRGKYMLVTNFELQIPIQKQQIYGLLFFDAGNSWLHRKDIKPLTGLYKGVGVGFRIMIPGMGTMGFDFGYALDDYWGEGKGWKPHFQYGTTF